MGLSFYPFTKGQKVTIELLDELIRAIQNGSIFTSVSFVSGLVTALDARVNSLESRMISVELREKRNFIRDQFTLSGGQSVVSLSRIPVLDSEVVALNGIVLAKNDIPSGIGGDYSISGSTLTLTTELALQVVAGDRLVVAYSYEVP